MCNVIEDQGQLEELNPKINFLHENSTCKKCNEHLAKVVLRESDIYCEKCFLISSTHKFRAVLGKSHLIRPGDRVLIAYSGGPCSSALLHLVQSGLKQNTHKKLRFEPLLLYIDESVTNKTPEQAIFKKIADRLKYIKFPYYVTGLSESLGKDISIASDVDNYKINEKLNNELLCLLSNMKSLTAKQDLLQKLKYDLIASVASVLNCKFVFLGDICTDLASTLLSNIALGRGAHLALDVAFSDTRYPNLQILRPMRDFVMKEVLYYNSFNDIDPLDFSVNNISANSIQTLTKLFVSNLQENFPATIYTIYRTGEKLGTKKSHIKESKPCVMCKAPIDTEQQSLSALQATTFSKNISTIGPMNCNRTGQIKYNNVSTQRHDMENLCYGCRLTAKDYNGEVKLQNIFKINMSNADDS